MRRALPLHLAALVAASVLFLALPGIDLWASSLFYRADGGFFLTDWGPIRFIFRAVPWLVTAEIVLVPVVVFAGWWRGRALFGIDLRAGIFLLLALALGPGLLVNTVLKDHWGRARPSQIIEFGGSKEFTAAPLPAAQCERNCSFVAGHPAIGFGLVAFAFLTRDRRRRRAIAAAAIGFGSLVGVVRIAEGGHFLSDVVFAGLLVSGLTWLLAWALLQRDLGSVLLRALAQHLGRPGARWALYALLTVAGVLLAYAYVDRPVALYFNRAHGGESAVFKFITGFGVSTYYLIVSAAAAVGLWLAARTTQEKRFRAYAAVPLFLFISIAASGLVTDLLKVVFGRARPKLLFSHEVFGFDWWGTQADYWSFPSGHTTTAVAIAAALYFLWPRFLPLYVAFAVLVSVSRAIVGAHYASDVIVATFIAIAVTAYVRHVFERSGIKLRDATAGVAPSQPPLPWRDRLRLGRPAAPQ
ncbi:MAG TPA: phosphatase PAP2 family protein [Stellaceae bacterium]|nr:phosphatase PAP2 family protein [Stellaceae bacterium]